MPKESLRFCMFCAFNSTFEWAYEELSALVLCPPKLFAKFEFGDMPVSRCYCGSF